MKFCRRGFTLIELLIVVAIIAILAAIAVPNFLEAQTRAKVSRVKADMRTVAVGLESYATDNNGYPRVHYNTVAEVPLPLQANWDSTLKTINPRIQRLVPITTPISYLSSIPSDVFSREISTNYDISWVRVPFYIDRKSYEEVFGESSTQAAASSTLYRVMFGTYFPSSAYFMRTAGPSNTALSNPIDIDDYYDPTNGSVSKGAIIYMQGAGFASK